MRVLGTHYTMIFVVSLSNTLDFADIVFVVITGGILYDIS